MVSVEVSWSGKTGVFFIDPQKTIVDQNCYIDLLNCLNVVDFIRAVTLNSCKTVLRHTVQKWRNSFYDRTLQTSYLLMNGHHIILPVMGT